MARTLILFTMLVFVVGLIGALVTGCPPGNNDIQKMIIKALSGDGCRGCDGCEPEEGEVEGELEGESAGEEGEVLFEGEPRNEGELQNEDEGELIEGEQEREGEIPEEGEIPTEGELNEGEVSNEGEGEGGDTVTIPTGEQLEGIHLVAQQAYEELSAVEPDAEVLESVLTTTELNLLALEGVELVQRLTNNSTLQVFFPNGANATRASCCLTTFCLCTTYAFVCGASSNSKIRKYDDKGGCLSRWRGYSWPYRPSIKGT